MAETTGTSGQRRPASSGQGSAGAKFDEAAASTNTKSLADQALLAGQDLTEKAEDLAGNSADALKAHASDFADVAKNMASQATDKLKSAVNERKSSGAEYVGTLADTMRRAAREFLVGYEISDHFIVGVHEPGHGIQSASAGSSVKVGASTIGGNGTGVLASSGSIVSFGNNQISDNGSDGNFTSTKALK